MRQHYQRKHHQIIAECLENFNPDYLVEHAIYFGGGTRIALELDEFRESIDIDFLCKDKHAFRAVREEVSSNSLGSLVKQDFDYGREIMFDRYGVRTFIKIEQTLIKLEFVAFDNYQLSAEPPADTNLFPIPYLDRTSCFMTKLLANADRAGVKPYKDILDLVVMVNRWGAIPEKAFLAAYSHYGEKVVMSGLRKALNQLDNQTQNYKNTALAMGISATYFDDVIVKTGKAMAVIYC